ncbi:MAG TPA: DNA polymerase Y family protein [Pedobacter sp.]
MAKRFLSIWFRYLTTDWLCLHRPELKEQPFVFAVPIHGRKLVSAMNAIAEAEGIQINMPTADAKAIVPGLEIIDEKPGRDLKLLKGLGEWCIRYSPIVALDPRDGLILDISGCTHLWDGERNFLKEVVRRLNSKGYYVRAAIADTVGAAWAVSRFGKSTPIIAEGKQLEALLPLNPAALRIDGAISQRLHKLGLNQISSFIGMPRSVLRRRFGDDLLLRLSQALGQEEEVIKPIHVQEPYMERLPCLEPIRTATGIEIAIKLLLKKLCDRLLQEGKGLRTAKLICYRIDGRVVEASIGTNSPSNSHEHLFALFGLRISSIEPALGIELFIMEASKVEELLPPQEVLWSGNPGLDDKKVTELLDRLTVKVGATIVHRYLPDEHYWPERATKQASSISEKPLISWHSNPRPTQLLRKPEVIEVSVPIPDYPPMLFRYKGITHNIRKADGPERIEREWWMDEGEHRDYYQVEDELGQRYWLFRSGHYQNDRPQQWFIHGYFA